MQRAVPGDWCKKQLVCRSRLYSLIYQTAHHLSVWPWCAHPTGDVLDEKVFREGVSWREPNVVVEPLAPEIEQLLLTGEGETVEFKRS